MTEPLKVLLRIGDTKLCVDLQTATRIFTALLEGNPQRYEESYRKPEGCTEYKMISEIKPFKPEQLSISYLSAAGYMMACAAGDSDAT